MRPTKTLKRTRRLAFVPLILAFTGIDAFTVLDGHQETRRRNLNLVDQQLQLDVSGSPSELNLNSIINATKPLRRQRQRRRKPIDRRPRFYWLERTNLCQELCQFWSNLGVCTDSDYPAIPNERLLMYYGRNDLRAAIVKNGGRSSVSHLLNGAPIIPGRWKNAVQTSPELQQLLQKNHTGLSPDRPPRIGATMSSMELPNGLKRWSHQNGRNKKGHWSLQTVIQKLYEYVDQYKLQCNRPAVWMPRPSEIGASGHDDLRQAINRYGGTRGICRTAGMVPYREWFYFEGQLELLTELKRYLDEFAEGDYSTFPNVSDVQRNGYDQLHALIQYYGGRKFLAARFSMSEQRCKSRNLHPSVEHGYDVFLKFGLFDLDFAIRLLTFVRDDHMKRSPPLQSPVLSMPSRAKLLTSANDGAWLDSKIDEFGGYENVARRLGLALFSSGNGKEGR